MVNIRIGLRTKLLLLSSFLFSIPWLGYQYVWEMEKYLRFGQEQTLVGTARALATALHERPNLFNNQASFLPNVEKGKDLYGFEFKRPLQLDGKPDDWPEFIERAHLYDVKNTIASYSVVPHSLSFTGAVGKFDKYLYLFFQVNDNQSIFRGKNTRSIFKNDHLTLSLTDNDNVFHQYVISNKQPGWLDAFRMTNIANNIPEATPQIQGTWQLTPHGYNIEMRLPLSMLGDKIAFSLSDVDHENGDIESITGSADTNDVDALGTIVVPSPEIERIVKGMSYTYSSIWVVDQHQRVLASAGDLQQASGVWRNTSISDKNESFLSKLERDYLHPIYYKFLTRPPKAFVDKLYDRSNLTGKHIETALNGTADSQWRLTTDQQALVLSAAYPIFIEDDVMGAVIVEETTNGIRTLRNRALEKLFTSILAILSLGTVAFFLFASRISNRIRKLRNQAELAIDEHGRIKHDLEEVKANDEIGDLSRSFSTAVSRLSQYNHYLENMSSRLSHELRTPIAVVRTSLENLTMQNIDESAKAYIDRAQSGIERLNYILTSMSEATRIEQMLQSTDPVAFDLTQVIAGCIGGYQQIHPDFQFQLTIAEQPQKINGSPEHFAQLLDKIISNAVDFSEDKKINIDVIRVKNDISISIANRGQLLPEQMQGKLFDSMVSVRTNEQQQQPHLGLGLFIARLICEYHHGTITAENYSEISTGFDVNTKDTSSREHSGVKIIIRLPLQD
ncbi:proteobacterial dedicated sortase system histidine kinase [Thalassotalea atypica]|uniref:proteobacterial dedicated sortase system histidine kinase n=1 Tax=Thalassotalea atypica TaxID=2054316 RepID=UPI003D9B2700